MLSARFLSQCLNNKPISRSCQSTYVNCILCFSTSKTKYIYSKSERFIKKCKFSAHINLFGFITKHIGTSVSIIYIYIYIYTYYKEVIDNYSIFVANALFDNFVIWITLFIVTVFCSSIKLLPTLHLQIDNDVTISVLYMLLRKQDSTSAKYYI